MRIPPHTSQLPFWPILTPQADSVLALLGASVLVVQLHQASAESGPTFLDSLIIHPFKWTPGLRDGVVCTLP